MRLKKLVFGERRLHPRKSCVFKIDLDDYYRNYTCNLRDLSVGGALLERPSHFRPTLGQPLLITISFRNKPGSVVVKGTVIRFKDDHVAVAFEKNLSTALTQAA